MIFLISSNYIKLKLKITFTGYEKLKGLTKFLCLFL